MGRKRGTSLEERLLAIRAASPEDPPEAGSEALPAPAPASDPITDADPFAAPESPESFETSEMASTQADDSPATPVPAAPAPPEARPAPPFSTLSAPEPEPPRHSSPLLERLSASEGDTFLPADHAAALAAVESAVRDLWPQAEESAAPAVPAPAEAKPAQPRLSRLLVNSWIGSHRDARKEPAPDEPPASEPEAVAPGDDAGEPELFALIDDDTEGVDDIEADIEADIEDDEEIVAELVDDGDDADEPAWTAPAAEPADETVWDFGARETVDEPVTQFLADEVVADEVAEPTRRPFGLAGFAELAPPETTPAPEPTVVASEYYDIVAAIADVETPKAEAPVVEVPPVEVFPVEVPVVEVPPVEVPVVEAPGTDAPAEELPYSNDDTEEPGLVTNEPMTDEGPWGRRVRTGAFGRIGTTLIERGLITNEQLDEALDVQRSSGRRVGDILVDLGALSAFELARVLADHMGVPFTDLRAKPPDPVLATHLPEEVARRYDALAIARWNEQLVIAMANPTDLFALDDLQMVTRQPIIAAMAVKEDLRAAIDRIYRVSMVETTLDKATSDYNTNDLEQAALQDIEVDEGPVVGLVNALMGQAVTDHASDLHIEPCSTHIAIRFRIDGVLHDASSVPLELLRPLVSRVKILAGLDIAQNRLAQDGRFSIAIEGRSVDVRAVCMPTAAGESVILRLLDPVRDELGIGKLGLSASEHARFVPACFASQGAVFIAGPTGSGKTSTVYSVLSEINTRSKSIVSIEDPVEFRLEGIKQLQINARVGLTFPTTLPTVLRSDPDVVFIGEVRDTETARIAADASITGHLVLSTLHATSAASTPMRLIEMGVEPYLVASALTLVASQRLARKLCERCAVAADPSTVERLRALGATDELLDGATTRTAVGCPACRGTGYHGRVPIFEIMPITEDISRLILDRASRTQIERVAVDEGMETLQTAALRRVVTGTLSIEEMVRVIS